MGEGKEREREGHVGEQRGMGRSRASAGMNIAREGRREGKVTERSGGRGEGRKRSNFSFWLRQMPPPLSAAVARSLAPSPPLPPRATASAEG